MEKEKKFPLKIQNRFFHAKKLKFPILIQNNFFHDRENNSSKIQNSFYP